MNGYVLLPLLFLKFWYIDSPRELIGYFLSFNHAFLQLFSLPVLLSTFFKPLKNEYREGLVGFSRIMGMIIKSWFITVDLMILVILLVIEIAAVIAFLAFPVATVWLLSQKL